WFESRPRSFETARLNRRDFYAPTRTAMHYVYDIVVDTKYHTIRVADLDGRFRVSRHNSARLKPSVER
ncbi:MAG: hypothetical protein OES79_12150, partial [Planctomycetota bacterium]|nr:hypothetical protein [Planctomycetota bacterium]